MDWDKIKVFYSVAESGSFTKAAGVLGITQSALSRQIGTLEDTLNSALFYRHARGLTLTEQGETLYKTAQEVFSDLMLVERQLRSDAVKVEGPLTIVAPVTFGSYWVVPRFYDFLKTYPKVRLNFRFSDLAKDLTVFEADISISDKEGDGEKILSRELVTFPHKVCSSREYLLKHGVPLTFQDLDHHQLVVFSFEGEQPPSKPQFLLTHQRPPEDPRTPYFMVNNLYTLARLVADGLGIGMLPRDVADQFEDLVEILPEAEIPKVTLYYSYARQLSDSKPVQAFYDFISQKIQAQEAQTRT